MRWGVYNLLFCLAYPFMMPKFIYRMWRRGGYRHAFRQRLGRFDPAMRRRLAETRRIWIHGVSVGEVMVAAQFIRAWRERFPEDGFVLSTTTSTGYRQAAACLSPRDVSIYLPLDYPRMVRRALTVIRPRALILAESELWPNLIRIAHGRNIPVFLVNGRISDGSFSGYRRLRAWFGPVLRCFDGLQAQSQEDARRLIAMGGPAERVTVSGTFKYDAARRDPDGETRSAITLASMDMLDADRLILMGGSTWPGEEALLMDIFCDLRNECAGLRLVLAPRHAERANEVDMTVRRASGMTPIRLSALRRGLSPPPAPEGAKVLVVDTTGDLMNFYAHADVVFVGKSMTAHGGQNMIEPASLGKAVLVGPHTENFRTVMHDLLAEKAIVQVPDAGALRAEVRSLLRDRSQRVSLGTRAVHAVDRRRGVATRSVERIAACLEARERNRR